MTDRNTTPPLALVQANADTMTSADVAEYLGIKAASVAMTVKRKGVAALPYRTGEGLAVYSADEIRSAWPDGADAFRGITFGRRRAETVSRVEVVDDVTGAPTLNRGYGKSMNPHMIKGIYINHHDGHGWQVSVTVHGPTLRKNGTEGADVTEHMPLEDTPADRVRRANPDHLVAPAWVVKWARIHTPPKVAAL